MVKNYTELRAPMSEPRQKTVIAPTANTEAQVFTVPYVLESGRAKAILRRIYITNTIASACTVAIWDEDIDGTAGGTPQRGTAAAPIIPLIHVASSGSTEIIFQGDANFLQYGCAVQANQNACHVQVEYDLQL